MEQPAAPVDGVETAVAVTPIAVLWQQQVALFVALHAPSRFRVSVSV